MHFITFLVGCIGVPDGGSVLRDYRGDDKEGPRCQYNRLVAVTLSIRTLAIYFIGKITFTCLTLIIYTFPQGDSIA